MTDPHDGREDDGKFAPGNAIWRDRSCHGRPPVFEDAESLWDACCEYFEWATANPLYSDTLVSYQGASKHEPIAQMRAFTVRALCLFLGITDETWRAWRNDRADLSEVIATAESAIYVQKFEGAAAGILNANLISRDLGLADRKELAGCEGGPIEIKEMSAIEIGRRVAFLLASGVHHQQNEAEK